MRVRQASRVLIVAAAAACQPAGGASTADVSGSTSTTTDASETGVSLTDDTPNVCGDGVVADDEGCDDGNGVDDDLCSNDCLAGRYVFVSSVTTTGRLQTAAAPGVYEADKICQILADASPIVAGRIFRAWLSARSWDGHEPFEWILDPEFDGWYVRTDGLGVARAIPPPTDQLPIEYHYLEVLERPIDRDEFGAPLAAPCRVWTNSGVTGRVIGPSDDMNCTRWSLDDPTSKSSYGTCSETNSAWSRVVGEPDRMECDLALHLYCFEVAPT